MFNVDYNAALDTLHISVRGHFAPDDVRQLSDAIGAATDEACRHGGAFDILVESLEFPVQAQDVADLLAGIMARGMPLTTGRAAIVVGSHLNKMQAERTLVHPRVRVFLALDDAQAWLNGDGPAMAAAQSG